MELEECLKKNGFELQRKNETTIVDLVRTLYNYCGYPTEQTEIIKKIVDNNKHLVFVLVDGMGSNLIDSLPDTYSLKQLKVMDLVTVNPSSTGAVLTTIATAEYPAKHGIIGWYGYNRKHNIAYYPVLFADRENGKDLSEKNITETEIYKYKSVMNKLLRETYALFPEHMKNSHFSKFVYSNDNNRLGYKTIKEAFNIVANQILNNNEPTFSYIYIPDIDSAEHYSGVYSQAVMKIIEEIEKSLIEFKSKVGNDVTTIITADHGQIDVGKGDVVMDFNKYNNFFYALPGIDFGTATYYVRSEKESEFEKEFEKDFAGEMFLFKTEEFLKLSIFGEEKISEHMRQGLGEYISFCKKGKYLINSLKTEEYLDKVKGSHSGFSREELTIPLIVM